MLQSSGLGNSLNAITSLLAPYRIPALVIVSMRGDEGEWNAAQVPMGQAVRPICAAIGMPVVTAETPGTTTATVERAGRIAFETRQVHACLLPRSLTAPPAAQGHRP
jgi:sulfopyruvate decarboxylase TPP-binding subunit